MSTQRNHNIDSIESLEPLILMSASTTDGGDDQGTDCPESSFSTTSSDDSGSGLGSATGFVDDDGTPDQGSGDAPGTPGSGDSVNSFDDDGTPDQGSGDAPGTPGSGTAHSSPGSDDGTPDQGSGDAPGTPGSGDSVNSFDDDGTPDQGSGDLPTTTSSGVESQSSVNPPNSPPVIVTEDHLQIAENLTEVGVIQVTDIEDDQVSFSIVDSDDAAFFEIDAATGLLRFKNAPDFENPADENGDNVYDVTIRVSDGTNVVEKTFWIFVTDVDENGTANQAPFFTNVSDGQIVTVPENTTLVGDANGMDPDGDPVTFSISDGLGTPGSGNNEDAGLFSIDPQTGVLSFKVAPDFENPADGDGDNDYHVTLIISDDKGAAQERKVVVRVTDVAEGGNRAPFFTNVSENESVLVLSGNRFVGDANASDPDGDPLVFSIAGGANANLFAVNAQTGVVSFINAPTFIPGGVNSYELVLRVSDGSLFQDRTVIVTVVDGRPGVSNRAPFFTNVEQGETIWFDENKTFVGDANAFDFDGDALTFSIAGGADAARFFINPQNGHLFFINAPDFENPTDTNGDNMYELTIRVSDGQLFQDRSIIVKVEDVLNA